MTPEGRVKAAVKRMRARLEQETGEPVYSFMPVQNGMGAPALDFYWCFRGHFIAIETKAPGKKMTARQTETRNQIVRAGGTVFVIDGVESSKALMLLLKDKPPKTGVTVLARVE